MENQAKSDDSLFATATKSKFVIEAPKKHYTMHIVLQCCFVMLSFYDSIPLYGQWNKTATVWQPKKIEKTKNEQKRTEWFVPSMATGSGSGNVTNDVRVPNCTWQLQLYIQCMWNAEIVSAITQWVMPKWHHLVEDDSILQKMLWKVFSNSSEAKEILNLDWILTIFLNLNFGESSRKNEPPSHGFQPNGYDLA